MTTINEWKRHVKTTTVSFYKRQLHLIRKYKRDDHIESISAFIRMAIDAYIPKFEKLIALAEEAKTEEAKSQEIKDKEFLEEQGITIVRKLESPPEKKVYY